MEKVIELRRSGESMHSIALLTGLTRSQVLRILVQSGEHHISFKKVRNGLATCLTCQRVLPANVEMFPAIIYSKFQCVDCTREYLHTHQIKKRGCFSEEYKALLKKQEGLCAVCRKPFGHTSCKGIPAKLAVDHDHKTGKIRGLLCGKCNRGLGWFCDSIELLQAAINYLNETQ